MASHEQTYSSHFKAKVALKALEQSKRNLDQLSEKHDIPVSVILSWTAQLERNAGTLFDASSSTPAVESETPQTAVDVETQNATIAESLENGVMGDHLNYKNLLFWAALGVTFVLIFVQLVIEMYQINPHITTRNAAGREFRPLEHPKEQAREELSSFGVVDLEKGIYSIPIDSAINTMAVEIDKDMTVEIDSNSAVKIDSE